MTTTSSILNFGGNEYGYLKKEFTDMDELLIVCGGSGTGKDTTLMHLYNETAFESARTNNLFTDTKTKFLFSVPETIPLFADLAEGLGIPYSVVHFQIDELSRYERILKGNSDNQHLDYQIDEDMLETTAYLDGRAIYSDEISENIKKSRERVLRDRESPFEDGVEKVKADGYPVDALHIEKEDSVEAVAEKLKEIIANSRKYSKQRVGEDFNLSSLDGVSEHDYKKKPKPPHLRR